MARVIGIDEAGLGPNFGPFVVALTVWEVSPPSKSASTVAAGARKSAKSAHSPAPGDIAGIDFWAALADIVTNRPRTATANQVVIADSKVLFQPSSGLGLLETGVWSSWAGFSDLPNTFLEALTWLRTAKHTASTTSSRRGKSRRPAESRRTLFDEPASSEHRSLATAIAETPLDPWYVSDLPLPTTDDATATANRAWTKIAAQRGIQLLDVRAHVVSPILLNRLFREYDNKSAALSRISLDLLRTVWSPREEGPTLVISDKHGGRDRYGALLNEFADGEFVRGIEESAAMSRYQIGHTELRFQPRAEAHLPVALASMTAKYLRETAMHLFNRYWQALVPGLKPTQGYPVDARRFHREIAEQQRQLGLADEVLWRAR